MLAGGIEVLLVFARVASVPDDAITMRPSVSMREERFDMGGRTMRYLTAGEGKPLLLCHGFLSSAEEFGGRFRALAAHRALIIPDLPGNGGSQPLRGRHTVDALAASLEKLVNALGVEEFDLAGLCLGASVASALTARCGARVDRLALHTPLIDAALIRRWHRRQVDVLTFPLVWQAAVALSRNRTVSNLYKRFIIVEGHVDEEVADTNFANQCRADPSAAREWLRDGIRHADLNAVLSRELPTLVIVPAHDPVVHVDGLRRRLAMRANVSLFVDDEQGHGWSRAAVQRQLRIMLDFFAPEASMSLAASA